MSKEYELERTRQCPESMSLKVLDFVQRVGVEKNLIVSRKHEFGKDLIMSKE